MRTPARLPAARLASAAALAASAARAASSALAAATAATAVAALAALAFPWLASPAAAAGEAPSGPRAAPRAWHERLYLGNGGFWRKRVRLEVRNESAEPAEGAPAFVAVGKGSGEADLAEAPSEAVRVVTEDGIEVLFAIRGPGGALVTEGPVPSGSVLAVPVECPARSAVSCYVYFDNPAAWPVPDFLSLEPQGPKALTVTAGPVEVLAAEEREPPSWDAAGAESPWTHRLVARVLNSGETERRALVRLDLSGLSTRLRAEPGKLALLPLAPEGPLSSHEIGGSLLLEARLPPRTIRPYAIFLSKDAAPPVVPGHEALLASAANLVANAGFEEGDGAPAGWAAGGGEPVPGQTLALDRPGLTGLTGERCARLHVPHGARLEWKGWRQDVPVEPGTRYLYAASLRCEDLRGTAQIHAHFRTRAGEACKGDWAVAAGQPISGTTGWTSMSGVFEAPPEAAVLQVHLTMLATGTLWHDGVVVARVEEASVGPLESRGRGGAAVEAWPVDALVKVFREDLPHRDAPEARLTAARGEKEPLQVAMRSREALRGVQVKVGAPAHASGRRLDDVEVTVAGYVPIDHATSYYSSQGPRWRRLFPTSQGTCDGWPGLWPDPLLPRDSFDLAAEATQPVWVTVVVPRDAPAGDYRGKVAFEGGGKTIAEVPFSVRVWGFELPAESHVKAIYDLRVAERWKEPGKSEGETWRRLCRFMAERRVSPDTIQPPPAIRWEGGQVTADFAEFDASAAFYFDELKLPHAYTPWLFYLFGWGFPPQEKFGEKPYDGAFPYEGADRGKLRGEFRRAYQACLKAYWDHLKEKGWEKKSMLYISDEPFFRERPILEQMKALCDMIHEVDRSIPIYCSTWHHVPEWDGSLDVWGLSHHGLVPPEKIAAIRAAGGRILWTTDGQMCTDTPYCAVERLLPHYAFKHGAEGYEFWGLTWLTYDPYKFGWHAYIPQSETPGKSYFIRYPNGDGYLAYPGGPVGHDGPVSSVRLEQAREGVEDYEYLRVLSGLLEKARAGGRPAPAAAAALERARRLIEIPNAGGRYSTRLLPDPGEVLRVKEALGEAIEGLRG